jgi:Xaa-Pro aminopeptidase
MLGFKNCHHRNHNQTVCLKEQHLKGNLPSRSDQGIVNPIIKEFAVPELKDVYKNRLDQFRQRMEEAGAEALIILKPENRAYLSGFEGSAGMLLITKNQALLLVDFRYLEQAKNQAPHFEIIQYRQPLSETLRRVFQELNLEMVGFERDYVTWEQYEIWTTRLGDLVEFIPLPDLTQKLRMVKGPEELKSIMAAVAIADSAFLDILPLIRPGFQERELAVELEYAMRRRGAQAMAFETIVASGPRSSLPHGVPTERVLQTGDLVIIDFGAKCQGYCSDCTRTVSIGTPTPKQREIYDLVQRAQDAALKVISPGVPASRVDAVARQIINEQGYGETFGHSLGHGVGRVVHEEPTLINRDQTILQPGMVVTVEPGVYLPGWGGVRIEDLVVVTSSGCEVLTHCIKGLSIT